MNVSISRRACGLFLEVLDKSDFSFAERSGDTCEERLSSFVYSDSLVEALWFG